MFTALNEQNTHHTKYKLLRTPECFQFQFYCVLAPKQLSGLSYGFCDHKGNCVH